MTCWNCKYAKREPERFRGKGSFIVLCDEWNRPLLLTGTRDNPSDKDTCSNDSGLSRLGQAMSDLNKESIKTRYTDKKAGMVDVEDYEYRGGYGVSQAAALKHLSCFLYQCAEGNIPEKSFLYKGLQEVSNRLAHSIVSDLPEYQEAEWG